ARGRTHLPYTTLFRAVDEEDAWARRVSGDRSRAHRPLGIRSKYSSRTLKAPLGAGFHRGENRVAARPGSRRRAALRGARVTRGTDRKSTRLNSSHFGI